MLTLRFTLSAVWLWSQFQEKSHFWVKIQSLHHTKHKNHELTSGENGASACRKQLNNTSREEETAEIPEGESPTSSPAAAEVWNATLRRQPLSFRAHQCLFQYPLAPERRGINGLIKDSQRPSWAPVSADPLWQLKRRFEERLMMTARLNASLYWTKDIMDQITSFIDPKAFPPPRVQILPFWQFVSFQTFSLIFNMFKRTNNISSKFMRIKTIRGQNKSKESRQKSVSVLFWKFNI